MKEIQGNMVMQKAKRSFKEGADPAISRVKGRQKVSEGAKRE